MEKGGHTAFGVKGCWGWLINLKVKHSDSISWQKLVPVRLWQAKFLIKESTSDSKDNLSKAAELAQLA